MSTVIEPRDVTDLDMAFPAVINNLLPDEEKIPEEFFDEGNPWVCLARRWFYEGLPQATVFEAKPGIELRRAMRHLRAVLGSFHVGYKHKIAAVAYLLALWFERVDPGAEMQF